MDAKVKLQDPQQKKLIMKETEKLSYSKENLKGMSRCNQREK